MSRDRKDITIQNSITSIDTRGDTRIEEGILIDKRTHLTLRVLPNFRGRKKNISTRRLIHRLSCTEGVPSDGFFNVFFLMSQDKKDIDEL